MYETVVKQVQDDIKAYIVPAILFDDKMARGKSQGRAMSLDMSSPEQQRVSEPKSLIKQLQQYYKQFMSFGMQECFIEQIFKQLIYYICAIALNNLMLRQDLCTWKTGMKIRFNINCLESWIKEKKMVIMF